MADDEGGKPAGRALSPAPPESAALVAARTVFWVAMSRANLRETPTDNVGGSDEPDDHPRPRSIEIVPYGRGDQGSDDDARPSPKTPLSGAPT